jgi:hypothetical protein
MLSQAQEINQNDVTTFEANAVDQEKHGQQFAIKDHRQEATEHTLLQTKANDSPKVRRLSAMQSRMNANNHPNEEDEKLLFKRNQKADQSLAKADQVHDHTKAKLHRKIRHHVAHKPEAVERKQNRDLGSPKDVQTERFTPKVPGKPVESNSKDRGGQDERPKAEPMVRFQPNAQGDAGENKGSADVTLSYFNAPASKIAKGIDQFGSALDQGLAEDAKLLTATTPPVTAELSSEGIPPPFEVPVPPPATPPIAGTWIPPVAKLRSDAPKFIPTKDTNPQIAESEAAAKGAEVKTHNAQANAQIAGMPGEQRVQGVDMNPITKVDFAAVKSNAGMTTSPEIETYMEIDMDDTTRDQADGAAAGLFQQTLREPKSKITAAKTQREEAQNKAIQQADEQSKLLAKKANEDQITTVAETRASIGKEKEKSLTASKAVMDEFDGKVSSEKQSKIDEINTHIATSEAQANSTMAESQANIAKENADAEAKKEEEKRKAQAEYNNLSWWKKIGRFFSNIFGALAKFVTSIVNKLASVVKSIIKLAVEQANRMISVCTSLVKAALNTFAKIVKGFLDVALAAFPGIRDKLNAAIDQFVAKANTAIDKVATQLKASIQSVADTLNQMVDFAQNFYTSMIQGGMMMFMAIITGNFGDLPKIAFMTACNSLGLPGDQLWGIVIKAEDQAIEIIKHPGVFLNNLIAAGKKGFDQFMANIKQHIISGLMGWLFGQVAQTGITIPDKFDAASIFMLIRQVLGITYEYVRQRAVGIIGEQNVERVEVVIDYLKLLFSQGPAAVYAQLKDQADAAKNTFVSDMEDWAIATVIQKATIKVMSMLIPGSGFVQSIYGMWQTLQFFIENIKKIAAVVNSLMDSLAQIMKGAISPAADLVEKTMVDTLPLVFAWLAKLIGIDGIGAKVKSIIDKLRTPVNKAVDFVINGAMKLGTKAVDAVKGGANSVKNKLSAWWQKRHPFTTKSGEKHELYFEQKEGKLVPMMASTPIEVKAVLEMGKKWLETLNPPPSDKKAQITRIDKVLEKITSLHTEGQGDQQLDPQVLQEWINILSTMSGTKQILEGDDIQDDQTGSDVNGGHPEDEGHPNQEEVVEWEDIEPQEIDKTTLMKIFFNLASHYGYKQLRERTYETWYNKKGVWTRSGFKALLNDYSKVGAKKRSRDNDDEPIQPLRIPGSISFKDSYSSSNHGLFTNVQYTLDHVGNIDFSATPPPHPKKTKWTNPIFGVAYELTKDSKIAGYGITLNGTKVKIAGASRGQHFSIANRIAQNGCGSNSPPDQTWHHLVTKYKMVLVDRMVHSMHGHNGGFYFW